MRRDNDDERAALALAALRNPHLKRDAADYAADAFLSGDPSGAIKRQEAWGQQALIHSDRLPKDMGCERETLEALGFAFGEDEDDLFVTCTLPAGWSKRPMPGADSRHTELVDAKGRVRGSFFYKAAFYDRCANGHLARRYGGGDRPVGGWRDAKRPYSFEGYVEDRATGETIFSTEPTPPEPEYRREDPDEKRQAWLAWQAEKEAKGEEAVAWLREHYPNFADPLAYWDED